MKILIIILLIISSLRSCPINKDDASGKTKNNNIVVQDTTVNKKVENNDSTIQNIKNENIENNTKEQKETEKKSIFNIFKKKDSKNDTEFNAKKIYKMLDEIKAETEKFSSDFNKAKKNFPSDPKKQIAFVEEWEKKYDTLFNKFEKCATQIKNMAETLELDELLENKDISIIEEELIDIAYTVEFDLADEIDELHSRIENTN